MRKGACLSTLYWNEKLPEEIEKNFEIFRQRKLIKVMRHEGKFKHMRVIRM